MKLNSIKRIILKHIFSKKDQYYDFLSEIIIPFIIKQISKLFNNKVDENLIIMGSTGGDAYIGNTKYLFEYLNQYSNYKLVWITKSQEVFNYLNNLGFHVVKKYSFLAIKLLRKAKFVFLTHGVVDILPIKFSPNTIRVLVWHGAHNKKVANATRFKLNKFPKWTKILKLKTSFNDVFDYFITCSGTEKDIKLIKHIFNIPPEKVITSGYPRNDILFSKESNLSSLLKKKYKVPDDIKRIILYAPTFRDNELIAKFPLSRNELLALNDLLKKEQTILLMKAHIYEKTISFKDFSNMKIVDKNSDIQELLFVTDILVTDYSSVYIDFLLVDRPILLFTYDYEEFMKHGRGFYYNFKETAPGPLLFTGNELINAIKDISKINEQYKSKRIETRAIFNKYIDGKSSERLLMYLKIIK